MIHEGFRCRFFGVGILAAALTACISSGARADLFATSQTGSGAVMQFDETDGSLINSVFAGGPPPVFPSDVNGDGSTGTGDILYLISYVFAGGPPPVCS